MNEAPLAEMCDVLDAIKIDLKGFAPGVLPRGLRAPSSRRCCAASGRSRRPAVHLEIVNLVVPTLNDSEAMLDRPRDVGRRRGRRRTCRCTSRASTPTTSCATCRRRRSPRSSGRARSRCARGCTTSTSATCPGHPGNHTYCPRCGALCIERSGFFVTAIHLKDGRLRGLRHEDRRSVDVKRGALAAVLVAALLPEPARRPRGGRAGAGGRARSPPSPARSTRPTPPRCAARSRRFLADARPPGRERADRARRAPRGLRLLRPDRRRRLPAGGGLRLRPRRDARHQPHGGALRRRLGVPGAAATARRSACWPPIPGSCARSPAPTGPWTSCPRPTRASTRSRSRCPSSRSRGRRRASSPRSSGRARPRRRRALRPRAGARARRAAGADRRHLGPLALPGPRRRGGGRPRDARGGRLARAGRGGRRLRPRRGRAAPRARHRACGQGPILAAMAAARALGARRGVVASYANSGDTVAGDAGRVVGYGAVAFTAGASAADLADLAALAPAPAAVAATPLSAADRSELLALARATLERWYRTGTLPLPRPASARLRPAAGRLRHPARARRAARLHRAHGRGRAARPHGRAHGAGGRDAGPRFRAVVAAELPSLEIEVSVLTPFAPVAGPAAIIVGRDGVLLAKDGRQAVFLPQVAPEQGWNRDEMLDQLCLKAGLARGLLAERRRVLDLPGRRLSRAGSALRPAAARALEVFAVGRGHPARPGGPAARAAGGVLRQRARLPGRARLPARRHRARRARRPGARALPAAARRCCASTASSSPSRSCCRPCSSSRAACDD